MFSIFIRSVVFLVTIQGAFSETAISPGSKSNGCHLPNLAILEDLVFKVKPQNQTIFLGSNVENFEILNIECKNGKLLKGQLTLMCRNGEWNDEFPTCNNYCNGRLLDTLSLRSVCDYRDMIARCPEKISSGTFLQLKCAYGYKREPNPVQHLRCLSNGNFDKTPESCEHNCGRVASGITLWSKEGTEIDSSNAPWHVAIYAENDGLHNYICGGSIISPTVIISAAHCFWDEINQKLENSTNLEVIAGKNSRNYSSEQSEYSQVIKVQEVHIPEEYRGKHGNQRGDIALLILAKPFKYSVTVAAVCVPKVLRNTALRYVTSNRNGFMTIFGKNNQLERINVKTLSYHDCLSAALISDDKFCAYAADRGVVWSGNSGAGFVTAVVDASDNTVRYNFWGVLSHSASSGRSRRGDQEKIAITNFYSAPSDFKRKVLDAMKKDELLF